VHRKIKDSEIFAVMAADAGISLHYTYNKLADYHLVDGGDLLNRRRVHLLKMRTLLAKEQQQKEQLVKRQVRLSVYVMNRQDSSECRRWSKHKLAIYVKRWFNVGLRSETTIDMSPL